MNKKYTKVPPIKLDEKTINKVVKFESVYELFTNEYIKEISKIIDNFYETALENLGYKGTFDNKLKIGRFLEDNNIKLNSIKVGDTQWYTVEQNHKMKSLMMCEEPNFEKNTLCFHIQHNLDIEVEENERTM